MRVRGAIIFNGVLKNLYNSKELLYKDAVEYLSNKAGELMYQPTEVYMFLKSETYFVSVMVSGTDSALITMKLYLDPSEVIDPLEGSSRRTLSIYELFQARISSVDIHQLGYSITIDNNGDVTISK